MLTTSYPRWNGDAGEFLADLVKHLADGEGVQVVVLAPGDAAAPSVERSGGAEVRRLKYFFPPRLQKLAYGDGIPWNLRRSLWAWLNVPCMLAVFAWNLCARYAGSADVVHAHWGVLGALAVLTRPIHRRPVMLTVHGTDLRIRFAPIRWITSWAVRYADAVAAPSTEFQRICSRIRGSRGPCCFLPHGIARPSEAEIERARASSGSPGGGARIVSVGRLIPERRHDLLVRAFRRVREKVREATLTIVGGGPQFEPLRALTGELNLRDSVRLIGRVPSGEVPSYLFSADLYVSPTTVDTFGTAVVEAAAHGLPVVTTRVGFPGDLVPEGEGGFVVDPGDEDALAEAMMNVLEDERQRARMGKRMRERIDELDLTWPRCAAATARIYSELVRKREG